MTQSVGTMLPVDAWRYGCAIGVLLLASSCASSRQGPGERPSAAQAEFIGSAQMLPDGTLVLNLRAEGSACGRTLPMLTPPSTPVFAVD